MKKNAFFGLLIAASVCITCSTSQFKDLQASLPDLNGIADGAYRGGHDIKGTPVKVTLDVVMRNHAVSSVNIVRHSCSPIGKKAETLTGEIVKQQSLDIDAVSGATASSKAILKAAENALQKEQ
ncbi:MAG: FMN-binding protein [Treponema sp.]|jgi:uncharacterized protein with FMN-binding domain|nr:FMN-binding protein [Treponema sp.]